MIGPVFKSVPSNNTPEIGGEWIIYNDTVRLATTYLFMIILLDMDRKDLI